jgi:hypothetical protein
VRSIPNPHRTADNEKCLNGKIVNWICLSKIKTDHHPMTCDVEIPREPLEISYSNEGFLPHVALHKRGELFFHESSYSAWWMFGILLGTGIISLFIYPIAFLFFLFGAVCSLAPFFIRNSFGHTIIIDPEKQTLRIHRTESEELIPMAKHCLPANLFRR